MRVNPNTLLFIFLIPALVLGLLLLSTRITSGKLDREKDERQARDIWQMLMDSTGSNNPFINNSLKW